LRWLLIRKQKGLRNPFVIEGVIHVMLMFRFLCEATGTLFKREITFRFPVASHRKSECKDLFFYHIRSLDSAVNRRQYARYPFKSFF
jgi:hypothetical protein